MEILQFHIPTGIINALAKSLSEQKIASIYECFSSLSLSLLEKVTDKNKILIIMSLQLQLKIKYLRNSKESCLLESMMELKIYQAG